MGDSLPLTPNPSPQRGEGSKNNREPDCHELSIDCHTLWDCPGTGPRPFGDGPCSAITSLHWLRGLVPELTQATIKPDAIDTVELVRRVDGNDEKIVFLKDAGTKNWVLREPITGIVEPGPINAIIRDLYQAKPVPDPNLSDNLTIHGLAEPSLSVTLFSGTDKSSTVNIGDTTFGNEALTYVTTSSRPNKPIAVPRASLRSLFRDDQKEVDGAAIKMAKWLPDYRIRQPLAVGYADPALQAESLKLTMSDKAVSLVRSSDRGWKFDQPANFGDAELNGEATPPASGTAFTGVRSLMLALVQLQVSNRDAYIANPGDLQQYGLDEGNDDRIIIELLMVGQKKPQVLTLGKIVMKEDQPVQPTQVYGQLQGDATVLILQAPLLDSLRATINNPGAMRVRTLIAADTVNRIDAIKLQSGPESVEFRKFTIDKEPTWILYGGKLPRPAKASEVRSLLTVLSQPRAFSKVLDEPNDVPFEGENTQATITLWADGLKQTDVGSLDKLPLEAEPSGEPITIILGKKDADQVYARFKSSERTLDGLVSEQILNLASRSRLAYVDPDLKGFVTQSATKLAFNQGNTQIAVEQVGDGWQFTLPESRKETRADPTRVVTLIGLLSGFAPERIVDEEPTGENLINWGLAPSPRMTITVTLDNSDNTIVYELGNQLSDGQTVYLHQIGNPTVVAASKRIFDQFLAADLRDPIIYRTDIAKVTKLTIRGWKGLITNEPLTYSMIRKAGEWVGETPASFNPDPRAIDAILQQLTTPSVAEFLEAKIPPEKVDVTKNPEAMEFTIEQADGPTLTLTLGSKAKEGYRLREVIGHARRAVHDRPRRFIETDRTPGIVEQVKLLRPESAN